MGADGQIGVTGEGGEGKSLESTCAGRPWDEDLESRADGQIGVRYNSKSTRAVSSHRGARLRGQSKKNLRGGPHSTDRVQESKYLPRPPFPSLLRRRYCTTPQSHEP
ncbi:hypothetical protein MUK42_29102 [Musa troglodytarum]|uniref:Uncharacterized protein n=1 Tax=Musa troglodytarum TaxID=320322 RepID=A0A9E7FLT6_9LILI|nr:hypothetical protein MUK42_29102 [Musa troglodytarum]